MPSLRSAGRAAALVAGLALSGLPVHALRPSEAQARAVLAQAIEATRAGAPPDGAWIEDLRRLGPVSIDVVLVALRSVPPGGQDERVLVGALRGLGSEPVLPFLREHLPLQDPVDVRGFLLALGATGGAQELDVALDLASPAPPPELEACVAELLARVPSALPEAKRAALSRPPELGGAIVAAIASLDSRPALDALVSLLKHDPAGLRTTLLGHVGALASRRPWDVGEEHRGVARAHLVAEELQDRREAVQLAGRLRDEAAVPRLLELLDDETLRTAAAWSLERITGHAFPTSDRWRVWLSSEEAWLAEDAPALLELLRSEAAGRVQPALEQAGAHRYHRQVLEAAVRAQLAHPDPRTRALAATTLGRLGATGAVDALLPLLGDPDVGVALAAVDTLTALTGLTPDRTESAWRTALAAS